MNLPAASAQALARRYPDVQILVDNLGIFEPKPFEEILDADWQRFFDVDVLSGVRLARLFLPAMRRADWGASHIAHQAIRVAEGNRVARGLSRQVSPISVEGE